MNCDCSKGGECECFSPEPGDIYGRTTEAYRDWLRKVAAITAKHGLSFMHDPGDGGFYDAEGNRRFGTERCPRATYEKLNTGLECAREPEPTNPPVSLAKVRQQRDLPRLAAQLRRQLAEAERNGQFNIDPLPSREIDFGANNDN